MPAGGAVLLTVLAVATARTSQRQALPVAAAWLMVAAVAGGYWFLQKRELAQQKDIARQRADEAQKLEGIIKEVEDYQKRKDNLQQRIDLINQLKQNQKGPVRIMDQISRDLPDLVWLDRMEISGGRISLAGRGLNPNAIALFVENIKNDPYFEEAQLGTMALVSDAPVVYTFDLNFGFTYTPKTPAGAPASTTTTGTGTGTTATQ